jgi:dTDP-4-dehydrorhamnose reductase
MIILLGGSGYVGQAYQRLFTGLGIEFRNVARQQVDYTNPHQLAELLAETRATFLINAAGYTGKPNVDACEDDKANCLCGNAVLPGSIRAACEKTGTPWGHVSSGCIFTGERPGGGGFREDDAPNFSFRSNHCSFYSGTKALGEEVLAGAPECYVWRLRIPFSEIDSPRNYLSKLMRYARLLDAANSLSQLDEFCRATYECWSRRVPFGTYNVTNPGQVSTREVVDLIRASGVSDQKFDFFADEAEFMRIAARTPRSNCVLDTSKLEQTGIRMTEVHTAIEHALRSWRRE